MPGGKYDGWERGVLDCLIGPDEQEREKALDFTRKTIELSAKHLEKLLDDTVRFMDRGDPDEVLFLMLTETLSNDSHSPYLSSLIASHVIREARRRRG